MVIVEIIRAFRRVAGTYMEKQMNVFITVVVIFISDFHSFSSRQHIPIEYLQGGRAAKGDKFLAVAVVQHLCSIGFGFGSSSAPH